MEAKSDLRSAVSEGCADCPPRFNAVSNGAEAASRLAAASKEPPNILECDICGAKSGRRGTKFRNLRDLKTHRALAHGRKSVENSNSVGVEEFEESANTNVRRSKNHVHFCPNCGCNLAVVNEALAFLEREPRK